MKTTENRTKKRTSVKLESSNFCSQHIRHMIDFGLLHPTFPQTVQPAGGLAGPWVVAGGCTRSPGGGGSGGVAGRSVCPSVPCLSGARSLPVGLWRFISAVQIELLPLLLLVVITVILDFIL